MNEILLYIWVVGAFATWITSMVVADDFIKGFFVGLVVCAFWPVLLIGLSMRRLVHGEWF